MKSAFDYFQEAAKCEQMASKAPNDIGRLFLLDAAHHWKQRGEEAAKADVASADNRESSNEDLPGRAVMVQIGLRSKSPRESNRQGAN